MPLAFAALVAPMLAWLDGARRPIALRGLAFAMFAYLPASNLIPLYRFLADSYLYLPLAGLSITVGMVVDQLVAKTRRPAFLGAACVIAIAALLAPSAMASASRFADSEALFGHAYARYPSSFMLCRNWSTSLGAPERVLAATDRCIARFGPEGLEKNRAVALFQLGRREEAVTWARRALARHPSDRSMPAELLEAASASPLPARPTR